MVDRIEIAYEAGSPADTAHCERRPAGSFYTEFFRAESQHCQSNDCGKGVPEKSLLHRGQIARYTDEERHK